MHEMRAAPSQSGRQGLAANRPKLLRLRAVVVSVWLKGVIRSR